MQGTQRLKLISKVTTWMKDRETKIEKIRKREKDNRHAESLAIEIYVYSDGLVDSEREREKYLLSYPRNISRFGSENTR